uniref:MocR-like pyridoxine biosynthesis transcription factor PdxR n=1 Tax=Nonomuraea sp. CA-252377 TaxID=3240003 RepID=UPI003F4977CC
MTGRAPHASAAGLDLHLDLPADLPGTGGVGRALESALREAVRSGRLAAGTRLPGSRSLATDLGIARGTVVQVYNRLVTEGWLTAVHGSGTRVARISSQRAETETDRHRRFRPEGTGTVDLRPGRPDVSSFPRAAWASSVREAVSTLEARLLDYPEPGGASELRAVIADYVRRTRGVRAAADDVVVVPGFAAGLALLARVFTHLGIREVATENPGFHRHRELLRLAGLEVAPLTVDASGADPAELTSQAGAVLLTPAHQYPLGVVLAQERRTAFIDWARRNHAFVIEDDYDGEFRYDGRAVGAMQTLAPDRVVYAGTTSKALAPGVRLAWLVVPRVLRRPVLAALEETGVQAPVVDQLALADLMHGGGYDRHVRDRRLAYRRRRSELTRRLAAIGWAHPAGAAAGLHTLLPVDTEQQERHLVCEAGRTGVRLHGLHTDRYWHQGSRGPAALVLGYATPPSHDWPRSLQALAALLVRHGR